MQAECAGPASLTVLHQPSILSVRYLAPSTKARAAHTAAAEEMYAPAKTTQHATKALAPGEPLVERQCSVPGVAYANITGLGFMCVLSRRSNLCMQQCQHRSCIRHVCSGNIPAQTISFFKKHHANTRTSGHSETWQKKNSINGGLRTSPRCRVYLRR